MSCHDTKLGDVYVCDDCGLELEAVKECEDAATSDDECARAAACGFECCGTPLKLKESTLA